MTQSRGGAPCKQTVVWKALVCKPPRLAQGCGREMAVLEQHCSRVASEKGNQGVIGLPDAVWTDVKTDQMCVGGSLWEVGMLLLLLYMAVLVAAVAPTEHICTGVYLARSVA